MSDKKQILLAFFIPLFLAVGLGLFGHFFLQPECFPTIEIQDKKICGQYHDKFLGSEVYALLVLGMIVLSLILPSYVMMRTYQSRRNKLESGSIIK